MHTVKKVTVTKVFIIHTAHGTISFFYIQDDSQIIKIKLQTATTFYLFVLDKKSFKFLKTIKDLTRKF